MPLQATSGAASYDAFGGGVAVVPNYIEECFSTTLYTGNGSTQTINNGIDLAGKGGLVWLKRRDASGNNWVGDTARTRSKLLITNSTGAEQTSNVGSDITSFNNNGFSLGPEWVAPINTNGATYASWTFRKQPKFFDVVTYTGDGVDGRAISHNLGAIPRFIIVKRTDAAAEWRVYAYTPTGPQSFYLALNTTGADGQVTGGYVENPTLTQFQTYAWSGDISTVNASGGTYVAYLFAHNAGGFGLTGTDNVISCGSFTQPSSGDATITLGYEPQWVLIKRTDSTSLWFMYDTMRQMSLTNDAELVANTSGAEGLLGAGAVFPTATGFVSANGNFSAGTYIYIAIRRGPMKVPTTGTSVFSPVAYTGNGSSLTQNAGITVDLAINSRRDTTTGHSFVDRLRGASQSLDSISTAAEVTSSSTQDVTSFAVQTGYSMGTPWNTNFNNPGPDIDWCFRRAPGFFDEVCYTGSYTAGTQTIPHNLGVAPELMLVKARQNVANWYTYHTFQSSTSSRHLPGINGTAAATTASYGANGMASRPTGASFEVTTDAAIGYGYPYVAYLFASCPGVSKVGSYTGTGTTLQINCGFTGGARFVLIKRTDDVGDWYVWDSARGIVAGNDPYLLLNSTAAEVTSTDYVDTFSSGFEISSTAPAAINASGGSYIFLAIA